MRILVIQKIWLYVAFILKVVLVRLSLCVKS